MISKSRYALIMVVKFILARQSASHYIAIFRYVHCSNSTSPNLHVQSHLYMFTYVTPMSQISTTKKIVSYYKQQIEQYLREYGISIFDTKQGGKSTYWDNRVCLFVVALTVFVPAFATTTFIAPSYYQDQSVWVCWQ